VIYVTGSNGLIGNHLKEKLYDFVPVSYRDSVDDIEFNSHEDATLIHLASSSNTRYSIDSSLELYMKDVNLSLELFKKFIESNPSGRIILLSSCGDLHWSNYRELQTERSVPSPKTVHGSHKLLLENYGSILTNNTDAKFISLRVTNVYGGDVSSDRVNGFIDKYINCFKNKSTMRLYANLSTSYDWIHIDDVVSAIISATKHYRSDTFLIGSGNSYSLNHLIEILKNNLGPVDIEIEDCTTPSTHVMISTDRAEDILGWKPLVSLFEGLDIIKSNL
jgi:nucleoside-diphosphate-sugar epimerase